MLVSSKPRVRMTMRGGRLVPVQNSYEGATRSRRISVSSGVSSGPNTPLARSLPLLQARSSNAIRNNAYATGAKETYQSNLVGTGIKPDWGNSEIQDLWDTWTTQTDADGRDSFYGQQYVAAGAQFEAGEVLTRFRLRRPTDGLVVPLQLQVMESAHLDPSYSRAFGGSMIKMGIEFDGIGRRSAYHLWRFHPHEKLTAEFNQRVPVPAANIVHMYRTLRPGQLRGVPELTPVLVTLYEIDKMQDATLARQTLAQLFGAFVHRKSTAVEGDDFPTFGVQTHSDEAGDESPMEFTSGAIHYLEDGEEVSFSDPPDIGSSYTPWLRSELLKFSRGIGFTHEQVTGDLKGVNYSSIRAGTLEFRRRAEGLQSHLLIHQWCKPIAKRFLDTAVVTRAIDLPDYWQNREMYHRINWNAPKWSWVDPLKEVMADLMEVRSGFKPRSEAAAERSWDLRTLDAEIKTGNDSADQHELVLDSDPRYVNKNGALHQLALNLIRDDEPEEEETPDGQESVV